MPQVGLEPTIPVFVRAKKVHALDRAPIMIGGLDDMEKRKYLPLQGHELRPLGRRARSQSLYRLLYPGFNTQFVVKGK
jgi:hypothetical protein